MKSGGAWKRQGKGAEEFFSRARNINVYGDARWRNVERRLLLSLAQVGDGLTECVLTVRLHHYLGCNSGDQARIERHGDGEWIVQRDRVQTEAIEMQAGDFADQSGCRRFEVRQCIAVAPRE